MKDSDGAPSEPNAAGHDDGNEKLDDLEPAEGEGAAVKGGGGTTQQDQGGSGPED